MKRSFGNKRFGEESFLVNDVPFSVQLLSLQEEAMLAGVSLAGLESESPDDMQEALHGMAGAVAELLQARTQGAEDIDLEWVMENLTVDDLEGIVEFLRSGGQQE